jgi:arginine:pyruvate transaminase
MRFSSLVERIGGEGAAAWDIHSRAAQRRRRGDDIILLSVGDPDFDTPAPIVDAAVESLRAGRTHYMPIIGEPELRRAIAEGHSRASGQQVGPENVAVLAGAQCALFCAALCVLDAGDEIIVPEPMYVTYEAVIGTAGARIVNVPLPAARHFALDPQDIAAAITPRTRAILVNSPHNPTGAMLKRRDWEAVAELCRRHDLWLLSDEVYAALIFEGEHVSPASLPGMAKRTVTINSLSKSHAMSGWRLGWVVAPEPLIPHIANLALCMLYGCPGFVQDAALAALRAGTHDVEQMRDIYRARRDLVHRRLSQVADLGCHLPQAGMFMMVDIRGTGLSAYQFSEGLLDAQGVSVLAGEAFGPSAAGHIRLSLGTPEPVLEAACNRIVAFARSLS